MKPYSLVELTFWIYVLRLSSGRSFHTTKEFNVLINILPCRWRLQVTPKRVASYQTNANRITTHTTTFFQRSSHCTRLREGVLADFIVRVIFWVVTTSSRIIDSRHFEETYRLQSPEVLPRGTTFRNVGNKVKLQFTVTSHNTWIIHARFHKIHFNIVLLSKSWGTRSFLSFIICYYKIPHALYMSHWFHVVWSDNSNTTLWNVNISGRAQGDFIQGVPGGICQTSGECSLC